MTCVPCLLQPYTVRIVLLACATPSEPVAKASPPTVLRDGPAGAAVSCAVGSMAADPGGVPAGAPGAGATPFAIGALAGGAPATAGVAVLDFVVEALAPPPPKLLVIRVFTVELGVEVAPVPVADLAPAAVVVAAVAFAGVVVAGTAAATGVPAALAAAACAAACAAA